MSSKISVSAGRRSIKLRIEKKTKKRNSFGEIIDTWEKVSDVWGNVKHLSGMEAIKADAITSVVKASIRIRYNEKITADMRAIGSITTYDIKAVLHDDRRAHTDLVCESAS